MFAFLSPSADDENFLNRKKRTFSKQEFGEYYFPPGEKFYEYLILMIYSLFLSKQSERFMKYFREFIISSSFIESQPVSLRTTSRMNRTPV